MKITTKIYFVGTVNVGLLWGLKKIKATFQHVVDPKPKNVTSFLVNPNSLLCMIKNNADTIVQHKRYTIIIHIVLKELNTETEVLTVQWELEIWV